MIYRSYTEGVSFLHRLNPTVKLLSFSLRRMAVFLFLSIGLFLFNALFYGGARLKPVFSLGPIVVYREGISFGASIVLRLLCVTSYSTIFVKTTDPTLLVTSLIHQGHLPYRIGYAILTAYRFIPILQRELSHIRDAHKIRGGYREGILARLTRVKRYGIPLLTNGIRKAERMAISMDARGFAVQGSRTYYRAPSVQLSDYLFLLATFMIIAAILSVLAMFGLLRGFLAGVAESLAVK